MTKSELFKKAHSMTKRIMRAGVNYRATFGLAVKFLIEQAKKTNKTVEILLGMGLKVWQNPAKTISRIYINKCEQFVEFAEKAGLDMEELNLHFCAAKRISSNKTWFDLDAQEFKSDKATVNFLFTVLGV